MNGIGLRERVVVARANINADEDERRRSNETEQNALTVMPAVFRLRLYAVTTAAPPAKCLSAARNSSLLITRIPQNLFA